MGVVNQRVVVAAAATAAVVGAAAYCYHRYSLPTKQTMHGSSKEKSHKSGSKASLCRDNAAEDAKDESQVTLAALLDLSSNPDSLSDTQKNNIAMRLKDIANEAYTKADYKEALRLYTLAINLCPEILALWCNRGACNIILRNYKSVVDDCTYVIERDPCYVKAYFRRGTAYVKLEKLREAYYDFLAMCAVENFQAEDSVIRTEQILAEIADREVLRMWPTIGTKLASHGNDITLSKFFIKTFLDTTIEFDRVDALGNLEKYPDNTAEHHAIQAVAFARAQEYGDCFNSARKAFEIADSSCSCYAEIRALYGSYCVLKGDPVGASEAVFGALLSDPDAAPCLFILNAVKHTDSRQFELARVVLDKALEKFPNNHLLHYQYGQLFFLTAEFEKASDCFARATALSPNFVYAYVQEAVARYKATGDLLKGTNPLTTALARPTLAANPMIRNFLGELLLDCRKVDEAEIQFIRCMECQVDDKYPMPHPFWNMGLVMQVRGDLDKAEKFLLQAIDVDPGHLNGYFMLAKLYLQAERTADAVKTLDAMVEESPNEEAMRDRILEKERLLANAIVAKRMPEHIKRSVDMLFGSRGMFD